MRFSSRLALPVGAGLGALVVIAAVQTGAGYGPASVLPPATSTDVPAQPVAVTGYLSGRLVVLGTQTPVSGATVRIVADDARSVVIASAKTSRNGAFNLATPRGDSVAYRIEVRGSTIFDGWVGSPGGGDPVVQTLPSLADSYPVGAVGTIGVVNDWITGTVVDDATAAPVAGVSVTARDVEDPASVTARAVTDKNGVFRLSNVGDAEVALRIDSPRGRFTSGYLGCNGTVVTDWASACPTPTGALDWIMLERRP